MTGGSFSNRSIAVLKLFEMVDAQSNVATIQNISIQKKSVEIAKKSLED